jgi:ribosomal protein S27E
MILEVECELTISVVFSHASTVVQCGSCATVLCQPTGGKAKLTEGELYFYFSIIGRIHNRAITPIINAHPPPYLVLDHMLEQR